MSTGVKTSSAQPSQRDRLKEALKYLLPETRSTLASLANAPTSIASAVVQLLPFGSRAALVDLGIVKRVPSIDSAQPALELTPFGFDVIDSAAKLESADPDGVKDLADRWDAAVSGYDVNHWSG